MREGFLTKKDIGRDAHNIEQSGHAGHSLYHIADHVGLDRVKREQECGDDSDLMPVCDGKIGPYARDREQRMEENIDCNGAEHMNGDIDEVIAERIGLTKIVIETQGQTRKGSVYSF